MTNRIGCDPVTRVDRASAAGNPLAAANLVERGIDSVILKAGDRVGASIRLRGTHLAQPVEATP